jgi:ketosteroid isomerase-like protein
MKTDTATTEIMAVLHSIQRAHRDKDARAITAHYEPNAVIFDLAPPLAHAVDSKGLQTWLDKWKGPVDVAPRDFDISVSGDLAFGRGYFQLEATTQDGEEVSFWMRATVCLKCVNGAWKIVHDHTSVPFYMDGSFKPAFDSKPELGRSGSSI